MTKSTMMAVCLAMTLAFGATSANAQQTQQAAQPERAEAVEKTESVEAERALRLAERQLQEAARRVAELSRGMAPEVVLRSEQMVRKQRGPRLGLQLATEEINGKRTADGIQIVSVSPASAAAEAGIMAGDLLVGFGGKSLRELSADAAVSLISKGLEGKQVGDTVVIATEREGKQSDHEVTLSEQSFAPAVMAFEFERDGSGPNRFVEKRIFRGAPGTDIEIHEGLFPDVPNAPHAPNFMFISSDSAWASMELVELSPRLGKYFGTESGLLVVRAPADDALGFEDGDIIRSIGGRTPDSVGHAMRILRSYESGEKLRVDILRDKKKKRLDIQVPEQVGNNAEDLHWQWKFESGNDGERMAPAIQ